MAVQKTILSEILKQEKLFSKARYLFVTEKIDSDDFKGLKQDYKTNLEGLDDRLRQVNAMLLNDPDNNEGDSNYADIYQYYKYQDISSKRYIIDLLTPSSINSLTGSIESLIINYALFKIFKRRSTNITRPKSRIQTIITVREITIDKAIKILKRNGIKVDEDQAKIILEFLYVLAKTYSNGDNTGVRCENKVFV